jgi:hypothetical protein
MNGVTEKPNTVERRNPSQAPALYRGLARRTLQQGFERHVTDLSPRRQG